MSDRGAPATADYRKGQRRCDAANGRLPIGYDRIGRVTGAISRLACSLQDSRGRTETPAHTGYKDQILPPATIH